MQTDSNDESRLSLSGAPGSGNVLLERKRLLLNLLSDREAIRVICAPPLYGKTVLASQYARLAFSPDEVTWVRASEPEFLLSLDSAEYEKELDESEPSPEHLVVFDGIAKLRGKRRSSLVSLMGKLHAKKCEVVVTTEDSTLASEVDLPVVLLDAREMALSNDELSLDSPSERDFAFPSAKSRQVPKRTMPPVVLDREAGAKRFVRALLHHRPATPEEALAYIALFVGSGDVSLLMSLFNQKDAPDLVSVERRYPYAGIRRSSSSFAAFDLSNNDRHELMCTHSASIAPFTKLKEEDPFNLACAELCMKTGNKALLALGLDDLRLRENFMRKYGNTVCEGSFDLPPVAPFALAEERLHFTKTPSYGSSARPGAASSPVCINLFGRCEITRDGVNVVPKGELRRKAKVVVALLLVNDGKELPRTWIERIVWPESNPMCVRSSFYNLWSYIRRILTPPGEEPFGSGRSRDTVSFSGLNFISDVVEVKSLCTSLHGCTDPSEYRRSLRRIECLYCGPLLPGVENDQLDTYRNTYQNRVLDALMDGVRVLIRDNDLRSAQHYAQFAFSISQTREDVVYHYMKVQQLLGQFAGALSAFVSCRRAMVDRFGIDGSSRLESLYREILDEVSSNEAVVVPLGEGAETDGGQLEVTES